MKDELFENYDPECWFTLKTKKKHQNVKSTTQIKFLKCPKLP